MSKRAKNLKKIALSKEIYPLQAVLNVCHFFSDRAFFSIKKGSEKSTVIQIKKKKQEDDIDVLCDEFLNELLFSALRLKVSENNKVLRESVLCKALYAPSEATEPQGLSYMDDPLGISIPWEEKYKKNSKKK